MIENVRDQNNVPGDYDVQWQPNGLAQGVYIATMFVNNVAVQTIKLNYVQ